MSNLFTEATRVQLTAIQHLARIGYTYLGKISECCAISGSGTLKDASSAALANIAFDSETNILVDIFAEQFKKLNPAATVSAQSVLSDIQKELDDDDLGQQFYKRLTSSSTLRLIDFEHPENNTYHCTAEFSCRNGDESFRPDITLFINGLPLVFIEVKKPNNVGGMVAESKRMNDERFPKKKFKSSEICTQSQVFELLGRAVYLCNVIELRLRWMHKHCGGMWAGKTPQELLESLKKTIEKQKGDKSPLGPIGVEMLEAIYTPRCNKELENAEKQGLFVFKFDYKIEWKGRLRHAKMKFKNFVAVRNTLVHYVARDYDLATPKTCQKAYADLKKKCEIIKDAYKFFNIDYEMMNKMMLMYYDYLVKKLQNADESVIENH